MDDKATKGEAKLPTRVAEILEEHKGVVPTYIPQVQPHQDDTEHGKKLELGITLPTMVQTPSLEMRELQGQLEELLDAGVIQKSKASHDMQHKEWVKDKQRLVKPSAGDLVMEKLLPPQHKTVRPLHKGLDRRDEWPFSVAKRVGNVSHKVGIPSRQQLHLFPSESCLELYRGGIKDMEQKQRPLGISIWDNNRVKLSQSGWAVQRRNPPPRHEYVVTWKRAPDIGARRKFESAQQQIEE